jgi:hypothetical protein
MDVNPQQHDPQFQSPLQGDREQQSQFGMQGQADMPNQPHTGTQFSGNTQPSMMAPGAGAGPQDVLPGAEVYGSDGKKLGSVQEVFDDCFLVQKGILFLHDYYVPYTFVGDSTSDRVNLRLTSDDVKNQDLSQRPGVGAPGGMPGLQSPPAGQDYGVAGPQRPAATIQGATYGGAAGVDPNAAMPPSGVMHSGLPDSGAAPVGGMAPGGGMTQAPGMTPADHATDYGAMDYGSSQRLRDQTAGSEVSRGTADDAGRSQTAQDPTMGAQADGGPSTMQSATPERGARATGQGMDPGTGSDYGTQIGTSTPMQSQTPPLSTAGRTGAGGSLEGASDRGLQGETGAGLDQANATGTSAPPDQGRLSPNDPREDRGAITP